MPPLVRVAQHLIGFGCALELILVAALVRVRLEGLLLVGLADVIGGRVLFDAEHLSGKPLCLVKTSLSLNLGSFRRMIDVQKWKTALDFPKRAVALPGKQLRFIPIRSFDSLWRLSRTS